MKLDFKVVRIHNFMSFKDEEFDLSENRGLTLVSGCNMDVPSSKNAAGKSSLFSSILYCLFGQLQYPIKNANLKNRYVQDRDMYVEVEFSTSNKHDGIVYIIRRSLNKSKQTTLSLFKRDILGRMEDLTKFSIAETDAFIQKEIIHCDISIFLRTIFLSSDQNYNFFKLTPSEKRNFIEKLFNISVFGEMYTLIHRDILSMDKDLAVRQNVLISLNRTLEDCENRATAFETEKEKNLLELSKSVEKLEESKKKIEEILDKSKKFDTSKIKEVLEKTDSKRSSLVFKTNELRESKRTLSVSTAKNVSAIESKQRVIDGHRKLLDKLCEKCRPEAESYYNLDKISNEIRVLDEKNRELASQMDGIDSQISETQDKIAKIDEKYAKLTGKLESTVGKIEAKKNELQKINYSLMNLKSNYETEKSSKNPYSEMILEHKKTIEENNKEIAEISDQYKYLKFAEGIVNTDTLKKYIIKDLVALLNLKIKYYLSKLGGNFECKFNENLDCEFNTPGGSCDYVNFSSGEQMRLMIATCFAFKDFMQTRNNFYSNILILDEFIDSGIDDLAIDGVVKIFEEFRQHDAQSIYVISHRIDDFEQFSFDTILKVIKENNISRVESFSI